MLQRIKRYTANGASSITAIIVFMILLPLTLAMTLIMFIAGIATIATRQFRPGQSGDNFNRREVPTSASHPPGSHPQKAPIEGSYTVVDK